VSRLLRIFTAFILISTVAGAGIMAQTPSGSGPQGRVNEAARTAELVKYALDKFEQGQAGTPQGKTPAAPVAPERPPLKLSADEAVKRALDNNIELTIQRLNPRLQEIAIDSVRAGYTPNLTVNLNENSSVTQSTSQLSGGAKVTSTGNIWNANLSKAMPWFGGNASVNWTNSYTNSDNQFATFNPTYQSRATFNYTQPLWRNFKIDSVRQQLLTTKIAKEVADLTLRSTLINTDANTRNAYWELWYAIRALDATRSSLALAEKLVEDNKVRVEVGTLAPLDVVSAQSAAATARVNVANAESAWQTAEITLKRLIVNSTTDPIWNSRIDPTDAPMVTRQPIDLEGAIKSALGKRTDVVSARRNMASSDISLNYLRNQVKPQADLVATLGSNGTGGTTINRAPVSQGSGIISTIPGGYGDAMRALYQLKLPSWTVQVNLSYPLGLSAAQASVARAKVQYTQSEAQLRALELQVATDLTNAALTILSTEKRLDASRAARELAEKQLEAEQSKFDVGMSTNYLVVQAQRDLANAQNNELRAMLDYRKALVAYERLQVTS
jgi:outer membrane protein